VPSIHSLQRTAGSCTPCKHGVSRQAGGVTMTFSLLGTGLVTLCADWSNLVCSSTMLEGPLSRLCVPPATFCDPGWSGPTVIAMPHIGGGGSSTVLAGQWLVSTAPYRSTRLGLRARHGCEVGSCRACYSSRSHCNHRIPALHPVRLHMLCSPQNHCARVEVMQELIAAGCTGCTLYLMEA
jgi:hypothetical protein